MGVRSFCQKSAPIQSPYCTNRATALLRCCPCQGLPPLWSSSVQAMLSEVLRARHEPTAGLSHLSTPDSILMSYQKSTPGGVGALGVCTPIGAKGVKLT
jgi:hypothetical protein